MLWEDRPGILNELTAWFWSEPHTHQDALRRCLSSVPVGDWDDFQARLQERAKVEHQTFGLQETSILTDSTQTIPNSMDDILLGENPYYVKLELINTEADRRGKHGIR